MNIWETMAYSGLNHWNDMQKTCTINFDTHHSSPPQHPPRRSEAYPAGITCTAVAPPVSLKKNQVGCTSRGDNMTPECSWVMAHNSQSPFLSFDHFDHISPRCVPCHHGELSKYVMGIAGTPSGIPGLAKAANHNGLMMLDGWKISASGPATKRQRSLFPLLVGRPRQPRALRLWPLVPSPPYSQIEKKTAVYDPKHACTN